MSSTPYGLAPWGATARMGTVWPRKPPKKARFRLRRVIAPGIEAAAIRAADAAFSHSASLGGRFCRHWQYASAPNQLDFAHRVQLRASVRSRDAVLRLLYPIVGIMDIRSTFPPHGGLSAALACVNVANSPTVTRVGDQIWKVGRNTWMRRSLIDRAMRRAPMLNDPPGICTHPGIPDWPLARWQAGARTVVHHHQPPRSTTDTIPIPATRFCACPTGCCSVARVCPPSADRPSPRRRARRGQSVSTLSPS